MLLIGKLLRPGVLLIVFSLSTAILSAFRADGYISHGGEKEFAVIAYYMPQRGVSVDQLPLDKLTHIIYSFSRVREGEMRIQPRAGDIVRDLVKKKEIYPDLKVMIACGGWGADGFSDMAVAEESRRKFAESAAKLVREYDIDGIDLDWEYPGIDNKVIKYRPEDTQRFTLVMRNLREELDKINPDLLLSFASAGWKPYYNAIETLEVMKYADFMNIMTYDQVGGYSTYTAHHTALGRIELEDMKGYPVMGFIDSLGEEAKKMGYRMEPQSAEKIIDYVMELGVDPKSIMVGGAFYGRAWKGVSPVKNGLYQPNVKIHLGWCSYSRIRSDFESNADFVRYWDPVAKAPYMYNQKDSIFLSYDDTVSIRLKTEYARNKGLGGIMFWQLSDDTKGEGSLLEAIDKAAK